MEWAVCDRQGCLLQPKLRGCLPHLPIPGPIKSNPKPVPRLVHSHPRPLPAALIPGGGQPGAEEGSGKLRSSSTCLPEPDAGLPGKR